MGDGGFDVAGRAPLTLVFPSRRPRWTLASE